MNINNTPFLQLFYFIKTMKISGLFSEDISFGEYVMLELITEMAKKTENNDVWVSDIVKQVEVTPQAVSKFLNMAVAKELIERFENINDRRGIGVRLTEHGTIIHQKTREELNSFVNNIFNEFSDEELSVMRRLVSKLKLVSHKNYAKLKKK